MQLTTEGAVSFMQEDLEVEKLNFETEGEVSFVSGEVLVVQLKNEAEVSFV